MKIYLRLVIALLAFSLIISCSSKNKQKMTYKFKDTKLSLPPLQPWSVRNLNVLTLNNNNYLATIYSTVGSTKWKEKKLLVNKKADLTLSEVDSLYDKEKQMISLNEDVRIKLLVRKLNPQSVAQNIETTIPYALILNVLPSNNDKTQNTTSLLKSTNLAEGTFLPDQINHPVILQQGSFKVNLANIKETQLKTITIPVSIEFDAKLIDRIELLIIFKMDSQQYQSNLSNLSTLKANVR